MKFWAVLLLSVVTVTGSSSEIIYQNNSLIFCLSPQVAPINLSTFNRDSLTGLVKLDEFIVEKGVLELSQWIPFAQENDRYGNIYLNRIYRVHFPENRDENIVSIKSDLQLLSCVHSVEFDYIRKPHFTPNDPQYGQQWFLPQIGANLAWNNWNPNGGSSPDGSDILLVSVDTGVDWDHVDLINNLWQNLNEDADGDGHTVENSGGQWVLDPGDLNGIDDDDWDNNPDTFIDDLIGWDLSGWSGTEDNNPQPRPGANNYGTWAHGTHVAGLLSASTHNGAGIASTAFNCRIMSVKVSTGNQSYPYITDGYSGILYAAKAGFHAGSYSIINNSWGGGGYSNYEQSVINICHETYDAVIFAAAGNGDDDGWGEEYSAHYPSSYEHVISVTALGTGDYWNHWATYHETVDLAAPGENIRSCVIGNNYSSWDGTSMATPIAASCAGLMRIYSPTITNVQIETMLIASSDPVIYDINTESYLNGRLGHGRVDIEKALDSELFPSIEFVDMDITLLDGGDNIIHPGEAIELRTILFNDETWGEAVGLEGELSTESNVFVVQELANFGNLAPGEATLNIDDPFIVQFPSGVTPGEVEFTLTLSSNIDDYMEYTEQLIFSVLVEEGVSQVEISIPYNSGWNLVGLPIDETEIDYMDMFPTAIEGTLFEFETNYTLVQTLNPGNGYWLLFSNIGTESILGGPIENLSINLNENWNLISGPSTPVSIDNIIDDDSILVPGTLYGFFNSYFPADYLIPGKGYWIRSTSVGQISFGEGNRTSSYKGIQDRLNRANKLSFHNKMGSTQTLYFGDEISGQDYLSFSLPPQPPLGINVFDVRFSGDFMATDLGGEIEVINTDFPIFIEADLKDNSQWILTITKENRVVNFSQIDQKIVSINSSQLTLHRNIQKASPISDKFELSAYPNPFNSSTNIHFSLSGDSEVTLSVYNIMGQKIVGLIPSEHIFSKGHHSIIWDGKNKRDENIPSGVYILRLDSGEKHIFQKLFLLK